MNDNDARKKIGRGWINARNRHPMTSDPLREAWVAFKSGQRWGDFLPDCRDETPDTHWRHDMFAQGFRAALSTSPAPREARNIADCGKDDCTPVEHWERVAMRAIAALSTTPAPLDNLTLEEDGKYHCRGCDAHDIDLEGAPHE